MMRILLALLGLYSFVQGTPWSPLKPADVRDSESTSFTTALTSPPTTRTNEMKTSTATTLEPYPSQDEIRTLRQLSGKLCEDEEKCLDIFIDLLNDRKPKDELIALLKNNLAYQKSLQTHKSYCEFMEKVRQSKGKISETAKVVWRIVQKKLESPEVIKGNLTHYTYKYLDYFLDVLMRLPILFDEYDKGPKHGLFLSSDIFKRGSRQEYSQLSRDDWSEQVAIMMVFDYVFDFVHKSFDPNVPFEEKSVQKLVEYPFRVWCGPFPLGDGNATEPILC